tara:strand:+ start:159 stop:623 length:465 start_codon:yes stop_codon:yes gene_type:complete
MEYKFEILKAEPRHKVMNVKYSAEGKDDFYKIFNPIDWSEENIRHLIHDFASAVIQHWNFQDTAPDSCPLDVGVEMSDSAEAAPVDYLHEHYEVPPLSQRVRMQREVLLKETDWMTLSDSSEISASWLNYRQILRDIPSQEGFPTNVTWPTKPE